MSRPEPTGENRIVEPEEIFFSTTDAKGNHRESQLGFRGHLPVLLG